MRHTHTTAPQGSRLISRNMASAPSIDTFIDSHAGNDKLELCAKLAITQSILAKERDCPLHYRAEANEYNFDPSKIEKTWYTKLFNILISGCSKENISDRLSRISFVIFNYDRCVEHFLLHQLQNWYEIGQEEAVSILEPLQFQHPYGQVGFLPWQSIGNSISFGEKNYGPSDHLLVAQDIRTFSEQRSDMSQLGAIRHLISEADTAVFLGFSFQPQNIELITPPDMGGLNNIYATAHGISASDQEVITSRLQGSVIRIPMTGSLVHFLDSSCHEFFREYHLTLSSLVQ